MNFAARLQTTIDLLTDIQSSNLPADAVSSAFFRSRRFLASDDQGVILGLVYVLLRHRARLQWWCERVQQPATARMQMIAWLMLGEARSVEQIMRLFNGLKFAPDALGDHEYAFATDLEGQTVDHPDMPISVRLECPDWVIASLQRRFGHEFDREMAATLTAPPLDLRVNIAKGDVAGVLKSLNKQGYRATAMPFAPHGIRLPDRVALGQLPGLKTGEIEIQDEGSQLVAQLVDAQAGERVVDFCAGAGGKTLALAVQMKNKGHLVACDVNEARLKRCSERLRRAGFHNGETRLLTSETDKWVKRRKGGYDRVLIDAPCSGTGTWRRNPDARWREWDADGLTALIALQGRILASAARLVKPGGRLVYATCSMLPEENEEQVSKFLTTYPMFELIPLADVSPNLAATTQSDFLSLTPARHDTDGFFAAVLRRKPEADKEIARDPID